MMDIDDKIKELEESLVYFKMKKVRDHDSGMDEKLKALAFYRTLMIALKTPGIDRIVVTLADDGEFEANVMEGK